MISLLSLLCGTAFASTETITFSELGFSNAEELDTVVGTNVTYVFSVGEGTTTPKYYDTGTAARLYSANTLTISSNSTITSIAFTYSSSSYAPTDGDASFDTGTYDYDTHTWTGEAASVVLTRKASSGHFRIQSITVTYSDGSTDDSTDSDTDGTDDDDTDGDTDEDTDSDASGSGTVDDPYNVAAAIDYTVALGAGVTSSDKIYIKGIISSITYEYSASYGTGTFYISDDGTSTTTFLVYSAYYLNNASWTESDTQIAVGDTVVIYGNVIYYKGTTPETSSKNAYLYSLNGVTESSSSTDDDDTTTDDGNTDSDDTDVETTDVTYDFTVANAYGLDTYSSDYNSSAYLTSDTTIVNGVVSLTLSTKYRHWAGTSSYDLRMYSGASYTIAVEDGYAIYGITHTGSKLTNQTASNGTYDSGTWTGNAQSVTFTQTGTVQISTITVSYAAANDSTVVEESTGDADDTDDDDTDGDDTDDEEEATVSVYKTYVKATAVESGKEYLIVAQRDDQTRYAYPFSSTYTYGYLYTGYVSGYTDTLQISTDYEDGFVITESDGLYSIMDVANSKYYYHSGTYNSFNAQTDATAVWSITAQDDGTFNIAADGYYIQWGISTYTTFGLYTEAQDGAVLPYLYEYVSTDTIANDTTEEEEEEETTAEYKTYAKTSTVEAGKEYLLVAQRDDQTRYAYPASSSYSYSYLSTGYVSGYVDTIQVSTSYEDGFIIDEYDDGYSIKDVSTDRYYYQTGTYKSFQISSTDPGTPWYIDLMSDGTFKIEMNGYYVQYGESTYTTFGIYTEDQDGAVYPYLYVLVEDEDSDSDDTDSDSDDTETGISNLDASSSLDADAPVYNTIGQRVNTTTKGILIKNGKKFINR